MYCVQGLETIEIAFEKELAVYNQQLLGLGAPDCLVVHRTVSGAPGPVSLNNPLSRLDGGVRL
jgi:hypothetical protein